MTENLTLKATVDTSSATASVGSLKKQLREAQAEVTALADKFGATSKQAIEAAKRAGELKDKIGDAKALTDAFNPDAKFKSLTASLSGVAGGFGAVQGAMALFGAESENVQKTLLKVQSAMAISQGLQSVGESIDSFRQLGAVIQSTTIYQKANSAATAAAATVQKLFTGSVDATSTGFKNLKFAMAATGIGLLVVAVGYLISNFDNLVDSITGVTDVQKELKKTQESSTKAISDFNTKLYSVQGAFAAAKKETLSKKEALKQYNTTLGETIGYANSLEQAEQLMRDNTANVVKSIGLKAQAQELYAIAARKSGEASTAEEVGFFSFSRGLFQSYDKELAQRKQKLKTQSADIKTEADNLINQALELDKLNVKGEAKPPDEKTNKNEASKELQLQKEKAAAELDAADKIIKLKNEIEILAIEDQYKARRLAIEQQFLLDMAQINANENLKAETKQALIIQLGKKSDADIAKINKDQADEQAKKDKDALEKKQSDERGIREIGIQQRIEDINKLIAANDTDFEADKERYAAKLKLVNEQESIELENLKLTEYEKTQIRKKYADERNQIVDSEVEAEKKAKDAKLAMQLQTIDFAQQAGVLLGQIAGKSKAIAIAGLLIEKGAAIAKIVTTMNTITPFLPPLGIPNPAYIPARIGAALSIASVIAASAQGIQSINSASSGGGGGGGMPSISSSAPTIAPVMPQAESSKIGQQAVGETGIQTIRAYVIESDVTNSQQRVEAIRHRARFS